MPRLLPFAVLAALLGVAVPAISQDESRGNVTTSELKSDSLTPSDSASDAVAPALLASSLLGQTIYALDGKRIGTLSDVVMTEDLDSFLAIVGIGGFLGFGARDVAIPKDRIAVSKNEEGELRLTIASTREQLQQAPVFDRTALRR